MIVSFLYLITFIWMVLGDDIHQEGYCVMYGDCGKKSFFGKELPCARTKEAVTPSESSIQILNRICGENFPSSRVCCSENQIRELESSLKRVDPIISSCPACHKNFYDFFCYFTCSANQSNFVNVTGTGTSIDKKEEIVTEVAQYVNPEYAKKFYESCNEIKFSATNGFAMDLIGGGATNYREFLKFLGDEKPLLGGSPFQVNNFYEVTDYERSKGLLRRNMEAKGCDSKDYKCACSDCSLSCPTLPPFQDFNKRCKVYRIPCMSFAVALTWLFLISLLGLYHLYIFKFNPNREGHGLEGFRLRPLHAIPNNYFDHLLKLREKVVVGIEETFFSLGRICAIHKMKTFAVSLALILLCSSGMVRIRLEKNPVNLWVNPSEPALKNFQYFEDKFGEWFRIEQIIVHQKNKSEPILSWDNIQWWFEKEQEIQELNDNEGSIRLSDLCFKPLGDACLIESFTQYFGGEIRRLNPRFWKRQLKSCTDSPVNCLPKFQQPLKKNVLFDNDDVLNSNAFVITILLNKNLTDTDYSRKAIRYEHALQNWVNKIREEKQDLKVDYGTEVSLEEELNNSANTDFKTVLISYLIMFCYITLTIGGTDNLGKNKKFMKKVQLGLGGILIIILSITSAAGILSYIGVSSTLIIAEVIPFLIVAIGVDNIFLIVHEFELLYHQNLNDPLDIKIAESVKRVGPSSFISTLLQLSLFLLASRVEMPAVKNFAFYSATAIIFNFLLQFTVFISVLSMAQEEKGSHMEGRPIHLQEPDNASSKHSFFNIAKFFENYYSPYILERTRRPKILTVFVVFLGVSLGVVPYVKLGLDQRLALPSDSYLVDYFDSVYDHLNVGPPMFLVIKNYDFSERSKQKKICGKFSGCEKYSLANMVEQEYKRGSVSSIAEPMTNWLDDFFSWLNPTLDQCCRLKKNSLPDHPEFCKSNDPGRLCQVCYADHNPPYDTTMEGFPIGKNFTFFFNEWINQPSDPCPLGGKAPYSSSIALNEDGTIGASYFRTSHLSLRSQDDFINAYKNSNRIIDEIRSANPSLDVFALSPFYVFFVQYNHILRSTLLLLFFSLTIIWLISSFFLASTRSASILTVNVAFIIVSVCGILVLWNVSLNAVTYVNIIICVGLAVEFTIHIVRAYLVSIPNSAIVDSRSDRSKSALSTAGTSVMTGITFTKFIGITVLAFARSKIFQVYYFRMWFALITIAPIHAFILLPILLSYFGEA